MSTSQKSKQAYRVAMLSVHTCPLAVLGGKEAGGMNVYVRELSKELGRRGIMVDIFTRRQSLITPLDHTLGDNARIIHLPAGPLKPYDKNQVYHHLPEFVDNLYEYQRSKGIQYDIIHGHYWLSGQAGLMLRERWNVPVVQMFHTLAQLKNDIARNEAEREPDFRAQTEAAIIQRVDKIVAATPVEKAQLRWRYDANPDKVETIPCGVDLRLFRPQAKEAAKAALGLTAPHIILLVGRIEPIKGVDVLIKAVERMVKAGRTDFQTLVVGGGTEGKDDNPEAVRLHALVRDLGLNEYIRFLPSQNQSQMPLFYSAADITVMSSHYESFGLAALESQACGTPVVATRVGGLPYAVQDKHSGLLFTDNDDEELAQHLNELLSNPSLRRRMGKQATVRAEQFSWRAVADRVIGLYENLEVPDTAGFAVNAPSGAGLRLAEPAALNVRSRLKPSNGFLVAQCACC